LTINLSDVKYIRKAGELAIAGWEEAKTSTLLPGVGNATVGSYKDLNGGILVPLFFITGGSGVINNRKTIVRQ